eukprot:753852-Hanusia_phi.AAC.2
MHPNLCSVRVSMKEEGRRDRKGWEEPVERMGKKTYERAREGEGQGARQEVLNGEGKKEMA